MGVPIYYRQCSNCGFVFCDSFLNWTQEDFHTHIYNADYALVDPEYAFDRPNRNAELVEWLFGSLRDRLYLVDYGGGNGRCAELLCNKGYRADSFDPFFRDCAMPAVPADIVSAFEVVEHSNRQRETLAMMASLLKEDGMLLFSTLLLPDDFSPFTGQGLNWWYIAPRNGHVSIHTRESLGRLFAAQGLRVVSLSHGLHLAYRTVPQFARELPLGQLFKD